MLLSSWSNRLARRPAGPRRLGRQRQSGRQIVPTIESLEDRTLLSGSPLLPDLVVLESPEEGFLSGWELDTHSEAGKTLLRLTTAIANVGAGPLELHGGEEDRDGVQAVTQHVLHSDGTTSQQLAGEWGHHEAHGHTHFEAFAEYNLRRVNDDGSPGEVVAGGTKTSFALMDSRAYDLSLPGAAEHSVYTDCLLERITPECEQVQGISVGWVDIYGKQLPGQVIDVTDVVDGDYWLEVIADPEARIVEADEQNNVSRILISLRQPDPETQHPQQPVSTIDLGRVEARRIELALDPHDRQLYRFNAAHDGVMTIELTGQRSHSGSEVAYITTGWQTSESLQSDRADIRVQAGQSLAVFVEGATSDTALALRLTNLVDWQDEILMVRGTDFDDVIVMGAVSGDARDFSINGTGYDATTLQRLGLNHVSSIQVSAGAGDDRVEIDPAVQLPAWLNGGSGEDVLLGGRGNDLLLGGAGHDRLDGRGGDDRLRGQPGRDRLSGGGGDDVLIGGIGHAACRRGR